MATQRNRLLALGSGAVLALIALALAALLLVVFIILSVFNLGEQKRQHDMANELDLGSSCVSPAVSTDGKFANPIIGRITSPFGPRPNPFGPGVLPPGYTSEDRLVNHRGVDIGGNMAEGTPFYAAQAGKVVSIGPSSGGNTIRIESPDGNVWIYTHAADGTMEVTPGQEVEAGDHLAGAGQTGSATAVHLHLELRQDGTEIDPVTYLAERGITLGQGDPTPVRLAGASSSASPSDSSASAEDDEKVQEGPIVVPIPQGEIKLEEAQVRNAAVIIGVGRDLDLSDKAIIIALMTAIQESRILNLASPEVPESLEYDHDDQAVNKASVGLFQQQHTMGWGPVEDLMNPEMATRTFFGGPKKPPAMKAQGLLELEGWENMRPGDAAQAVQNSGHPDKYHQWETTAKSILAQVEGTSQLQCHTGPKREGESDGSEDQPGTTEEEQAQRSGEGTRTVDVPVDATGEKLAKAARSGIGGDYEWGSAEFKNWDASGFVHWVYEDQGISIPRTAPWTAAERTESPQPGDIVAQRWDSDRNRWDHVGIYVGDGRMVSAVNEETGTRDHPVAQLGEPTYFTVFGKD